MVSRERGLSVCEPRYAEGLLAAINALIMFPVAKGSLKTRLISHRSVLRSGAGAKALVTFISRKSTLVAVCWVMPLR